MGGAWTGTTVDSYGQCITCLEIAQPMNISSSLASRLSAFLLPATLALAACSPGADKSAAELHEAAPLETAAPSGDWTLVPDASRLSFVSIKNNAVTEAHRFNSLSGNVSEDGMASLEIELASVDTGIEIRDQRMREMLFETTLYPQARVSLKVDPQMLSDLQPGEFERIQTQATLALHALSASVPAQLRVTRVDAQHWLVTSEQPVVVNAAAFNLLDGLEKLREVAGLQAIGGGAPVSFTLLFKRG